MRDYLINKGLGEYVNELYGAWDNADDIDFDALPQKFVLKCNHGCNYNIIVDDKEQLDIEKTRKVLNDWLKEDFEKFNAEPHYGKIDHKIICEEHLGSDIMTYNIYCCNGEPKFFYVMQGRGKCEHEAMTYYWADGTRTEFRNTSYPLCEEPIPQSLDKMKEISIKIAARFPFVRVDFFEVDGKIWISELTFTPGGGLASFDPAEYDEKLGDLLDISMIQK